jgi:hypothetical protein
MIVHASEPSSNIIRRTNCNKHPYMTSHRFSSQTAAGVVADNADTVSGGASGESALAADGNVAIKGMIVHASEPSSNSIRRTTRKRARAKRAVVVASVSKMNCRKEYHPDCLAGSARASEWLSSSRAANLTRGAARTGCDVGKAARHTAPLREKGHPRLLPMLPRQPPQRRRLPPHLENEVAPVQSGRRRLFHLAGHSLY